jgi:hypothetical protein
MYLYIVTAKGFKQCKKSDPNLNECLKDGLQSAIPHLVKGKSKNTYTRSLIFIIYLFLCSEQ